MIKLLIKNRLYSVFGAMIGRSKNGEVKKAGLGKIILMSLLLVFIAFFFVFYATVTCIGLGALMIPAGAAWLYYAIILLISISITFFFSIFETKTELFECKDNELLLSMPIKPSDIVISRIFVVLFYNYLTEAVIALPALVVYAVFSGPDIIGIIGGIIAFLFAPLLSTALAAACGYLVALIARKLPKKSFITVILSVGFLVLYFWGYSKLMSVDFDGALENLENISFDKNAMPVLYHIGAVALLKPLNTVIFVLACSLVAFVAYKLISASYIKIATDTAGAAAKAYKKQALKQGSALKALTKKEFSRFLSSSTYMMNAGLGLVAMLAVPIIAVFNIKTLTDTCLEMFGINYPMMTAPLVISVLVLLSSMNMMSASALSLEGNNFWIIRSLPIDAKTVLYAKVLPQLILTLPLSLVASVIAMIVFKAPLVYIPIYILTPMAANIAFALFGTVINTAIPKFNFENEVQVIKQSLSTFIVLMAQFLISIIMLFVSLFAGMASAALGMLISIAVLVFFVIASLVLFLILRGPCARKYNSLIP